MNCTNWIEKHANFVPDRIALRFLPNPDAPAWEWSYADFAGRVRKLARGLRQELGIGRGDRIAFLGYNHPDMLALLFACARLGAILVPLNWRLAPAEHEYILRNAGVSTVVCEQDFLKHAEHCQAALPENRWVALGFTQEGWVQFNALLNSGNGDDANPGIRPETPLLLVYTSGTTGRPKGAVLTQEALFWNALNSVHLHDFTSQDHVLSVLPHFHVGPLNIQTTPALYVGAEQTLTPKFDPGLVLRLIQELRPTLLLFVPVTMQALLQHPDWESTDLSSLRMIVTGSSVVPINLIEGFHQRGIPVGQVYGSTETCPIAAVLRSKDAFRKIGSTGKPALHCEVRVMDEDKNEVPDHMPGELWVRGPNVMREYWGNAEATAEVFRNGWYRSGDVGYRDEDGFLFIHDRKRDIIISGGENIYPAEIEGTLNEHPGVVESAVVGREDAQWGEVPVAFIITRSPETATPEALKAYLQQRLARFKHPKEFRFLATLPRNTMGKVLRYELRALALESVDS